MLAQGLSRAGLAWEGVAGGGVQGRLWLGEGVSVPWLPRFSALLCRGRFRFRLPRACSGVSRLSRTLCDVSGVFQTS